METQTKVNAMIRLDAGHDRNGNPRRVYVAIGKNIPVLAAIEEGYRGPDAVPEELRAMAKTCPKFKTTPGEYRQILREFPNKL